jgi:hypothetical protein
MAARPCHPRAEHQPLIRAVRPANGHRRAADETCAPHTATSAGHRRPRESHRDQIPDTKPIRSEDNIGAEKCARTPFSEHLAH